MNYANLLKSKIDFFEIVLRQSDDLYMKPLLFIQLNLVVLKRETEVNFAIPFVYIHIFQFNHIIAK
jgi:hypothetical protein